MSFTWVIFEMMGTIAFAFSGAMVGITKRMDIFGITVLAVMTAVGGGMVRDVLVGVLPPSALRNPSALMVAVATALVVSFLHRKSPFSGKNRRHARVMYHISDTVGLASFTVTGALTALYADPSISFVLPLMLGLITAVGGGMLRDIMARRLPVVLYMDVYAVASLAGGFILCLLWDANWVPRPLASWMAFLFVMVIRGLAIYFRWQLYNPTKVHRRQTRKKSSS